MSSHDSSSSDSEVLQEKISKKTKGKSKQPTVVVTPHGKNEGANTDWAYQVPLGATLAGPSKEGDEFDLDAFKDDDEVELWIMRVPQGITAKNLEGMKLDVPSGSTSLSAKMGSLVGQSSVYDVWSLGEDAEDIVGAEEVKGLTYLAPRHKKRSKLFAGSKIPTRHLALSARPHDQQSIPGEGALQIVQQNPPRPSYPIEALTHRFVPFGSLANTDVVTSGDSVDVEMSVSTQPPKTKETKSDEVKAKKRKVEGDGGSRKSKKSHGSTK